MKKDEEKGITFLSRYDMKKKPVFKEIFVETGHPEHAVNGVSEQLEDMGFKILSSGSTVSQDNVADTVKDYFENIQATRTEKEYRLNAKLYKQLFWLGSVVSIIGTFIAINKSDLFPFVFILYGATALFYYLSQPKIKSDFIWLKVKGKLYEGTKSREVRDTGKDNAGITKSASSTYIHSEVTFMIAGDSQIDVARVRGNVDTLSKHIQKI